MINHNINPVLIELPFGLEVRYYGLVYILGIIISIFAVKFLIKKLKNAELQYLGKGDNVLDLVMYVAISGILGGRIGYFLFYNIGTLFSDFLELFRVWNGGMSFHGGLIGASIGLFIYSKKYKKDFWLLADILVIPGAIALFFGRIANFINAELYGRLYDGFLCINYESNQYLSNMPEGCRYPSQIVEAIKNLVIFITLVLTFKKIDSEKYKSGTLFFIFVFMYGLMRFFIEYIRQPDSQLGFVFLSFSMGQILCFAMMISAVVFLVVRYELFGKVKFKFK